MIQIAFESAYDPYHTAFRVLRLLSFRGPEAIRIGRLRIIDVYLSEPRRCADIRLSGVLKSAARKAVEAQRPIYGKRPGAPALLSRMAPMQDAAIQTLVFQGFLDAEAFSAGEARRSSELLSSSLQERIDSANAKQAYLMNFLCHDLEEIPYEGRNGLKDRTGLGEYRYDVV